MLIRYSPLNSHENKEKSLSKPGSNIPDSLILPIDILTKKKVARAIA
jgi:uncharacterized protein YceK